MPVNRKKSIKIKNRTKYFDQDKDKVFVQFGSPLSYQSRQIKIEGYETRLYWQFRYCDDNNGQTFFYTLTYNDVALPRAYGLNCFDYEDLRDLLTGGFRKMLLRKYGTTFKYFIGAELGDGKGTRGMHNNPHYHVLFFLEPANNPRFPYVKISPVDFRHLVRKYWQGFDEDKDGYRDYNQAKYGIAKEGENTGLVTDFRACMYCAKYVCKDAQLKQHESEVERKTRFQLQKELLWHYGTCRAFLRTVLYQMFNTPLNASCTKWLYNDCALIEKLLPGTYREFYNIFGDVPAEVYDMGLVSDIKQIVEKYGLREHYMSFFNEYITPQLQEKVNEWRNRYSNKCRISQGVGDYALQHIKDKMNPTVKVPGKKGFKNRPIGMYYYRKLFTDVLIPEKKTRKGEIIKYPPVRVLNELGQKYKLAHLPQQLARKREDAMNNLNFVLNDPALFEKMRDSDINVSVTMNHEQFLRYYKKVIEDTNKDEIIKRYAEYKLVYEDRFLKAPCERDNTFYGFPDIDVNADYTRFLVPSIYSVSRSDLRLDCFLESAGEDYLPYSEHPYFLRYLGVFHVLDMCADYWFVQKDDKDQREAEERARVKRFHTSQQLKEFYAAFNNR